ncbi:hypothetical protein OBBRIDRAFT_625409 [Obba rivulosa]|uniref:Protein kinase domain-containing protein n=1 Tax=Obba rivulosa TaxID=1052685 RepID=A0A8E2ASG7_9APHY|nr:hypothetical protein OBBRIDRAFT_625409 [Obba rivulosa]
MRHRCIGLCKGIGVYCIPVSLERMKIMMTVRTSWCGAYIMVVDKLSPDLVQLQRPFVTQDDMHAPAAAAEHNRIVHSRELMIRDVKPENCATGLDVGFDSVHVFDFGPAKLYEDPNTKKHIPYRDSLAFVGTARYASYNASLGRELSHRDGLEALGNSLLYLFHGSLHWQGI